MDDCQLKLYNKIPKKTPGPKGISVSLPSCLSMKFHEYHPILLSNFG
jgi:hypothetical protein